MSNWTEKYFTNDELEKIKQALEDAEKRTCGEIMVSLRHKRKFWERLYKPKELAVRDFERLGLTNTKNKTGVLLFIIFIERHYDILADEGIYTKIPDAVWNEMEEQLKGDFRIGDYYKGIMHIIKTMGDILEKECPIEPDDEDEIRNELTIN